MSWKYVEYQYASAQLIQKILIWINNVDAHIYFALKGDSSTWGYYAGNGSHALATGKLLTYYATEAEAQTNYLSTSAYRESTGKVLMVLPSVYSAKYVQMYVETGSGVVVYEWINSTYFTAHEIITGELTISDQLASAPLIKVTASTVDRIKIGNFESTYYGIVGYDGSSQKIFELSDNAQQLAGWAFTTTTLASSDSKIVLDSSNKRMSINDTTFGNAGIQLQYNSGNPQAYIGNGSTSYMKYTTAGGVEIAGSISATTGHIGGFEIGATTISAPDTTPTIKLDSANTMISLQTHTFGSAGVQLQYASSKGKFYAGDGSNNYFQWDGTNVSWKGVNTELTAAGAFTASSATITGEINATSGYFTSVTLGKTGAASGTLTLQLKDTGGDTYINYGKTDFTNVDAGFILGIDDSDSNKGKFYIGDSTSYLNWDGSALTYTKGTLVETIIQMYTSVASLATSATAGDGSANSAGIKVTYEGLFGCGANQTATVAAADANVRILADGNAYFKGDITATSGYFTSVTLGKTGVASGTLTLQINDGSGNDTYIAAGKTDFVNTGTEGFILGIDDTDNKAKFYIGNTTDYLNWDGASFSLRITSATGIYLTGGGDMRLGCSDVLGEVGNLIFESDDTEFDYSGSIYWERDSSNYFNLRREHSIRSATAPWGSGDLLLEKVGLSGDKFVITNMDVLIAGDTNANNFIIQYYDPVVYYDLFKVDVSAKTIYMGGNITLADGVTLGQAAGPLLTFDDTNNYLEITGCSVGILTATPAAPLDIRSDLGLYIGAGNDLQITLSSDDVYFKNATQDKDIYIQVNDGGSTTTPLFIDSSATYVAVNSSTANARFGVWEGGLTLNYAAIEHGMTSYLPTNAFLNLTVNSTTEGGLDFRAASDTGSTIPLILRGLFGNDSGTNPAVMLYAAKKDGTGIQNLADTEIALAVNNGSVRLLTADGAGNISIKTATTETGSTATLNIPNGTAPNAHVDNQIIIYSADSSDSTATLALYLEQAVEDIGTFTASHKIKVFINGTAYWLQLDAV